jgi:predicted enzyme related to lactoylglutathione lyase
MAPIDQSTTGIETMRNPFSHGVGGVLSADIAVPDHERELAFYKHILTTGDAPLWRADLSNNQGTPIIGLGVRTPEYETLPLQWMPHFQVADVAASVACAIDMGGKVLMHSRTENGQSQWAVLTDQFGAAFGVIPVVAGESDAARQNERYGCIAWLSLTVPDALSSRDFYRGVVGWSAKPIATKDSGGHVASFEMQIDNETAAAEIRQKHSEHESVPSVWLIHLPVDDLVESLRRINESDGDVIQGSAEAKCAVVRDPVGVCLALQTG